MVKKNILIRVIICLVALMLVAVTFAINSYGAISVIMNEDVAVDGKYEIDCLGEDNELFIYGYSEEDDTGELIYSSGCDETKLVKEQYIYQAVRLVIKNGDDSDDRIDYEEWFDTIADDRINVQMDTFEDKTCFTVESKKYVDVRISNVEEEQVKSFYHCFLKSQLTSTATRGDSTQIVEVYIDEKLKKEFVVSKPDEQIKITFQDLSLIDDDLADKLNVKITNPSGITQKLSIIDTNLQCGRKSFSIGYDYVLICNRSVDDKDKLFFIQLQDSSKKVYFDEHTIVTPKEEETDVNKWWIVFGVILVLAFAYKSYKDKSSGKDRNAISQLEDEDDK